MGAVGAQGCCPEHSGNKRRSPANVICEVLLQGSPWLKLGMPEYSKVREAGTRSSERGKPGASQYSGGLKSDALLPCLKYLMD